MKLRIYWTAGIFIVASLWANSVYGQTGLFFDEFGAGYKATAMGQAFTAVADDYSAAYYNLGKNRNWYRSLFRSFPGYSQVD